MAIENQKLRERFDRVFSTYIRMEYAGHDGFAECYTCTIRLPWQELQCGHFIDRQHSSVRFHENNCRPQCYDCNMLREGKVDVYEERLRDDIGDKEVDKLIELGREERSYSNEEYKEEIHKYTLKIREMGGTV